MDAHDAIFVVEPAFVGQLDVEVHTVPPVFLGVLRGSIRLRPLISSTTVSLNLDKSPGVRLVNLIDMPVTPTAVACFVPECLYGVSNPRLLVVSLGHDAQSLSGNGNLALINTSCHYN